MAFNGNEGEVVSLDDAARWTKNYRDANEPGVILAHAFGKSHIDSIQNQDGCVGIRIYHGIDDDGEKVLILVGVDANEDDMETGIIIERATPCPPYCGKGGKLNK